MRTWDGTKSTCVEGGGHRFYYELEGKPMSISMGLVICLRAGPRANVPQGAPGCVRPSVRFFLCLLSRSGSLRPGVVLLVFPVDPFAARKKVKDGGVLSLGMYSVLDCAG